MSNNLPENIDSMFGIFISGKIFFIWSIVNIAVMFKLICLLLIYLSSLW